MINSVRAWNFIEVVGDGSSLVRDVRFSDVVICDSMTHCHCAVGLAYDVGQSAKPFVTCGSTGKDATRIVKIGKMKNVYFYEDGALARNLLRYCKVGESIPPMAYQPVAKVLAETYAKELKGRRRK